MSIKLKLIILLLLIGLVPTLVVSFVAYVTISQELTRKTVSQLESLSIKQEQKVQGLLQKKKEEVVKLANRFDLQNLLSAHLATGNNKLSDDLNTILYNKKIENSDIQASYLTDLRDIIIASTTKGSEGQSFTVHSDFALSESSQNGVAFGVQEDKKDGINKLFITTTIKVNQKEAAILTVIFRIDDVIGTVQDYTGLGSTGETMVAAPNKDNKYISLFPLRFDTEAALKRDLSNFNMSSTGNLTNRDVVDYRGKHVIETVRRIAVVDWPIAIKIDASEAFAPIAALRNILILIVVASSVAIIVIALYFTRFFAAPIVALTGKTRSIMEGDFTQRIAVTSSDEVGALATAFNEMTESLQVSTRELGEEHARLLASINSLDIGFLMTTRTGQVVSCNPAMTELLSLDKDRKVRPGPHTDLSLEWVQKQLVNFDLMNAVKTCLTSGNPFTAAEVSYGSRFLSIIGAPIRLERGEIIGSVMVVEDITEAKILARSRDEFFSIASHELRTPLTAIKGNTRMIMDYYADLLKDPSVKQMLNDIHESSVRLIEIVNDFLDVSRIEQGKMSLKNEVFQIEKVIESVVYEMEPVLNEKKLHLRFDKMALGTISKVWADTDRTKQIIYNLVGNAAKFTEAGSITVDAVPEKRFIKITVSDTGRGIPLDKQELLFRKFQQAGDSLLTRDTTRGTGLGLYISKMLAERMGGKIRLESSREGEGSTFSFTLPVATAVQQSSATPEPEANA